MIRRFTSPAAVPAAVLSAVLSKPLPVAIVAGALLWGLAVAPTSSLAGGGGLLAQEGNGGGDLEGPVGPMPYEIVTGWQDEFAEEGFAFGGNSGVWAESPDRIFVSMRGETRLPDELPDDYLGFAGSIGINVLTETDRRTWRHCLYTLNGDGEVREMWDHWDHLCENSDGPGPHRLRINPYDPEGRVWVINETFHVIYVFSNDGRELLMTLGERGVPGDDWNHFAKPQDVAFLPDGRILVADGLDNHRIVVLDSDGDYISEFGGYGTEPGQFQGIHAVAVGPGGRIFALDRSGGRVNVYRTTDDIAEFELVDTWDDFNLPLDILVNDDAVWMTDLDPLRFIKLDFEGNHLYTWLVPSEMPDGFSEVHTLSVDSELNLYAGDNIGGRLQKLVPKPDADPELIIRQMWVAP